MRFVNKAIGILIIISFALSLSSAQQAQPSKESGQEGNRSYGIIFDVYDATRTLKYRNYMLDGFAGELRNTYPNWQGYLVSYGGRISYEGEAKERVNRLKRYLVKVSKIDESRIHAVDGGYRSEWVVELWLFPSNSPIKPSDMPSPTLAPTEVKIIDRRRTTKKKRISRKRATNNSFDRSTR